MKAHERTEEWLKKCSMHFTIIREGFYNESWPLYSGHYDVRNDDPVEIPVAGDCKISWTSIPDLGLANAMIRAAKPGEWKGKVFYLAQEKACTLEEVAAMVSKSTGKDVKLKIVPRIEHEQYYVKQRGMDHGMVTWWSKTYHALNDSECEIHDPTLEQLLAQKGVEAKPMEETIAKMMR